MLPFAEVPIAGQYLVGGDVSIFNRIGVIDIIAAQRTDDVPVFELILQVRTGSKTALFPFVEIDA